MSDTALLGLRLMVLLVLFGVFLVMERRRRPVVPVLLLLGIVLADASLYASTTAAEARSLFHPELFGQSFRLSQLAIPAALLAAFVVRGLPMRLDASAPFWAAFFAWTASSAVLGLLAEHQTQLVLNEATIIVHVGGMMLLAASVPARDYLRETALPRFLQVASVAAGTLFVLDLLAIRVDAEIVPDVPFVNLGDLGADAATLFGCLGAIALVLGLARRGPTTHRMALLVPAAILLGAHLASAQRAARLGIYVTLVILLVVAALPTARRRLGMRGDRVALAAAGLAAVVLAAVFVPAMLEALTSQRVVAVDTSELEATNRQGSIESRFNQWAVVVRLIADQPLTGEGLGGTFVSYSAGLNTFVETNISHNIALDLLRRTGVVGVVLAGAALFVVLLQAATTWKLHRSTPVAALAVAVAAATLGLLAKGMVESIFEKDRLAVMLGFLLGVAISTALSHVQERDLDGEDAPRSRELLRAR
jgi:O-antigen ligase